MTSCHDVLEHLSGASASAAWPSGATSAQLKGLGSRLRTTTCRFEDLARTQASKTLSPVPSPTSKMWMGPSGCRAASLVQPHRPKHVLRLRPRAMNAVVEHVHLRVVEGVASVFGLSQLHRAKVKILPSPPTQTAQNPAGPGPGDPSPSMTPSIPPPASRWPCASTSRVCVHVAGVHVQRDVQVLRPERRPKPQVHPSGRRANHPSKEHVEALGRGTRLGVGHVFFGAR